MCLRGLLDRHRDLFDGVEYNAMYTSHVNFNRAAERWATLRGKALVGNGDVHRLHQLGTTFSVVDAIPDADAICAAIAEGRVRVECTPLGWYDVARTLGPLFAGDLLPRRRLKPSPPDEEPDEPAIARDDRPTPGRDTTGADLDNTKRAAGRVRSGGG
jgi:hypothetical protein